MTNKKQTVVIENNGKPEICEPIENIMFCMKNHKRTELNENNQVVNIYYSYKIEIDEEGFPVLVCMGRYD